MNPERLTTLAAVKEWLDISTTTSDALLLRLINAASQFVLSWLNRDTFRLTTYTQNFRGNGKCSALLANWPVVTVSSVGTGGVSIPSSTIGNVGLPGAGYTLSDARNTYQSIDLHGSVFGLGCASQVVYTAGFTTAETAVMPAAVSSYVTYTPVMGQWTLDKGVKMNGVTLSLIATPTPGPTQYYVDDWGVYTFNAAAAGQTAVISYDYVPFDVSFAVTELIGEWYKRKDRIGLLSKNLGGQETVTFSQKDMGDSIRSALQPYVNVVPI